MPHLYNVTIEQLLLRTEATLIIIILSNYRTFSISTNPYICYIWSLINPGSLETREIVIAPERPKLPCLHFWVAQIPALSHPVLWLDEVTWYYLSLYFIIYKMEMQYYSDCLVNCADIERIHAWALQSIICITSLPVIEVREVMLRWVKWGAQDHIMHSAARFSPKPLKCSFLFENIHHYFSSVMLMWFESKD